MHEVISVQSSTGIHRRRSGASPCAFSLIELLASIAVIAILAAIVVSVIGRIRSSSEKVTCASNLRQIGTAISLYTNDHSGMLPGPAYSTFGIYYFRTGQDKFMLYYVGQYLGMRDEAPAYSDREICRICVCPAFERIVPESDWTATSSSYVCQWAISNLRSGTLRLSPWGKVGDMSVTDSPLRLSTLNSLVDASTLWAVRDMDAGVAGVVHGDFRNTLFFDWHVESVPVN